MALAHAILALLSDHSHTGYDLARDFDGSVGFFWKATHQQIYRELADLEEQGRVRSEVMLQEGRPNKKIYHLTPEGRDWLARWIPEPCEPGPNREDLLVKTFAGALVPPAALAREIERHRVIHVQKLAQYHVIQQKYFPDPAVFTLKDRYGYLTLRRGIRQETEWIDWCDEVLVLLTAVPNEAGPPPEERPSVTVQ